jgi:hypothetical protein
MKVIIGGAQRSGTSFLRSILGSHSSLAIFPYDLRLFTRYLGRFGTGLLSPEQVESLVQQIVTDEKAVIVPDAPTRDEVLISLGESGVRPITALTVFDTYLSEYARKRRKNIWGLKTPWNEFFAEIPMDTWTDAVFIHLIRNPLDSAASAIYVDGGSWFYDPGLHISRWMESSKLAEINKAKYPGRYFAVNYDQLKADPQGSSKELCQQLGLSYEEGMELGLRQPGWSGSNTSFGSQSEQRGLAQKRKIPRHLEWLYLSKLQTPMRHWGYLGEAVQVSFSPNYWLMSQIHMSWVWFVRLLVRIKASFDKLRATKAP